MAGRNTFFMHEYTYIHTISHFWRQQKIGFNHKVSTSYDMQDIDREKTGSLVIALLSQDLVFTTSNINTELSLDYDT